MSARCLPQVRQMSTEYLPNVHQMSARLSAWFQLIFRWISAKCRQMSARLPAGLSAGYSADFPRIFRSIVCWISSRCLPDVRQIASWMSARFLPDVSRRTIWRTSIEHPASFQQIQMESRDFGMGWEGAGTVTGPGRDLGTMGIPALPVL